VIGAADELVEDAADPDEELDVSAVLDDDAILDDEIVLEEGALLDKEALLNDATLLDDETLLGDTALLVDETLLDAALGSPQVPYSGWQPSPQKSILEPPQKSQRMARQTTEPSTHQKFRGPQQSPKILPRHVSPVTDPQNPSSLTGGLNVDEGAEDVEDDVREPPVDEVDVVDTTMDEVDVLDAAPVDNAVPLDKDELIGIGHGCTLVSRLNTAQLSKATQVVKVLFCRHVSNAARLSPMVSCWAKQEVGPRTCRLDSRCRRPAAWGSLGSARFP
jgi:hypothetical protein